MMFSRVLNSNGPWCRPEEKRKFSFFFWCLQLSCVLNCAVFLFVLIIVLDQAIASSTE